jgi:hypothetical protein
VRDYIKGYVSFSHKVLVCSKKDAFPPPSEKWLRDPA